MKKLRFIIAIWFAKLVFLACKLKGSRASTMPGKMAHRICPQFLSIITPKVRGKIIAVCGTNGKTTASNLINDAALAAGCKTVCNNTGANMINGIATAFAKRASLFGGLNCDYACLEVDEATMPILADRVNLDIIVVTNLFRDQLDRYGDSTATAGMLTTAFDKSPNAALILNADDPVTSAFGRNRDNTCYYGILQNPNLPYCGKSDVRIPCSECGGAIDYAYRIYEHLGKYTCANCVTQNVAADFGARNIRTVNGTLDFEIVHNDESMPISTGVTGMYNVYNMLMSMAACTAAGMDIQTTLQSLRNQQPQPGRMSRFTIGGKDVFLILSKNAVGFNQSFTLALSDSRPKDILVHLNDTPADGEDISWLWDVDFETLYTSDAGRYIITGERRYDIYLRLKYAGYDESKLIIEDDIKTALGTLLGGENDVCYAAVNYSDIHPAFLELDRLQGSAK